MSANGSTNSKTARSSRLRHSATPPGKNGGGPKKINRRKHKRNFLRVLFTAVVILIVFLLITTVIFGVYVRKEIIPLAQQIQMGDAGLKFTSIIYYTDENGEARELEQLHGDQNRIWVDYNHIPSHMVDAFIAIEDERFRKHKGVDWKRTIGAFLSFMNPSSESKFGGSTITQQLIKNMTGDDDISPKRKITEIFRALELEKKYSKEQIMEMYLNTIALGNGLNGVQTASNRYFGKDVSDLSLAQSACLAGITQHPSKWNPLRNPENNLTRQKTILDKMLELKLVSQEEYDKAVAEEIVFQDNIVNENVSWAQSYYVDMVVEDVIRALREEKGYTEAYASRLIYSGGLQIYAAVDPDVQRVMEKVYADSANFPKVSGDSQPESAMVVMDPYTGAIKGVVGGRGQKTDARGLNRATMSLRQPGSAIKPLSVFAPGLEYGWITGGSVLDDAPVNTNSGWPKNQSGRYQGLMSIKRALELSVNTVPVRILTENNKAPERAFNFMTANLGFTSLVKSKEINGKTFTDIAVAPMALGGLTDGITVLEMTAAYCPFVNRGIYNEPYSYTKVLDHSGNVLLENKPYSVTAMKESTAYIMNKLMQNIAANGTARAARFDSGIPIGGKTGTTDDDKDRWFVGYSPYYVGAVWFGHDKPKTLPNLSPNPALAAWKAVMQELHKNIGEKKKFASCDDVIQAQYCLDSGMAPGPNCELDPRGSRIDTAWFEKGTQPSKTCDRHVPVQLDSTTGQYAAEYCPPENQTTAALVNFRREYPSSLNVTIEDAQFIFQPFEGEPFDDPVWPVFMSLYPAGTQPGLPSGSVFCNTLSTAFREPAELTEDGAEADDLLSNDLPDAEESDQGYTDSAPDTSDTSTESGKNTTIENENKPPEQKPQPPPPQTDEPSSPSAEKPETEPPKANQNTGQEIKKPDESPGPGPANPDLPPVPG